MTNKRDGESASRTQFRTDRMFQEDDGWYFHTREGTIEGPFSDRLEANNRLEAYIRLTNSGLAPMDGKYSLTKLEA